MTMPKNTPSLTQSTSSNCAHSFLGLLKPADGNLDYLKSSSLVAIIAGFLKALSYAHQYGQFTYWGINPQYITASDDNWLYSLLLYVAVAIVLVALNAISYSIVTSTVRRLKQITQLLIYIFIIMIPYGLYLSLPAIQSQTGSPLFSIIIPIMPIVLRSSFLLALLTILIGIILGVTTHPLRHTFHTSAKKLSTLIDNLSKHLPRDVAILFILSIIFSLYILFSFFDGYFSADDSLKPYSLISNNQIITAENITTIDNEAVEPIQHLVVLSEKDDYFIVSPCTIYSENDELHLKIFNQIHVHLSKEDLIVQQYMFDKINRGK